MIAFCLVFGADLVDSALRDEDVVELIVPELSAQDVVVWNGITRSITLSDVKQKATPVTTDVTSDQLTGNNVANSELSIEETEETEPDEAIANPISEPESAVDPSPESKSLLRRVLVLILILLLVGAGGWYFYGTGNRWTKLSRTQLFPDEETSGQTDEEATQSQELTPDLIPEPEPELSPYEQGLAALANGKCNEARNLISKAINAGSGEAALLMAEKQDSVSFESCMHETPNDIRALSNYSLACEKGVEGAKEKLDLLEAELKRRSDEGNVTASKFCVLRYPKRAKPVHNWEKHMKSIFFLSRHSGSPLFRLA